jgi:3-isopropylmalate dehydrogenase
MQLVRDPAQFDVVVADNLFADLLSDQAGMVCGSLGMLPSASFGDPLPDGHRPAIYEPVHGSAPDITGQDLANPIGTILSVAMMLRHSLACPEGADLVEAGVGDALAAGHRTRDLLRGDPRPGQTVVGCTEMRDAVLTAIDDRLAATTESDGGS